MQSLSEDPETLYQKTLQLFLTTKQDRLCFSSKFFGCICAGRLQRYGARAENPQHGRSSDAAACSGESRGDRSAVGACTVDQAAAR